MWRETNRGEVAAMQCPIFSREEDFCLLDNCRYYDIDLQTCRYHDDAWEKTEQQAPTSQLETELEKGPEEATENRAGVEKTVSAPAPQNKEPEPSESNGKQQVESPSFSIKLNAKEIWDLLNRHNETGGVPGYESLIESLIQVVNSTPGIHYLTPKETDFWRSRVHGIERYLEQAEAICK